MSVIVNPAAGGAIGGPIIGGTAGSVLFINPNNVLAQDNANFFWDDTNHILKLEGPGQLQVYNADDHAGNFERGILDWTSTTNILTIGTPSSSAGGTGVLRDTRLYTAGKPAIYRIANANGDNWFEDNAGNFTLTGFLNFGTGDTCLSSITSGTRNTGYGSGALQFCTTGFDNFGIGFQCLQDLTTGDSNVGVGTFALQSGAGLSNNVALGFSTLRFLGALGGAPVGNIGMGTEGLVQLRDGYGNIALGYLAATNVMHDNRSIYIGENTCNASNGTNAFNTMVGSRAGFNVTAANYCTILGHWEGPSATLTNVIAINDGAGLNGLPVINQAALDWNFTNSNVWSFKRTTSAQGLHIYKTFDDTVPTVNYERAALSWIDTANTFRLESQAGGTGTVRIIAIDGFQKAGAPAAADLPSGTWGLINDTSGNATWLCYNNAGTIRKVQLV